MPSIGTRAFCCHLRSCCPQLQVLGLCDFDPAGVGILAVYKHGSREAAAAANAPAAADAAAAADAGAAPSSSSSSSSSNSAAGRRESRLTAGNSLEGPMYALHDLLWLGARTQWVLSPETRAQALQDLTEWDRSRALSLISAFRPGDPWADELRNMVDSGAKAELEALADFRDGLDLDRLSALVVREVNAGNFV